MTDAEKFEGFKEKLVQENEEKYGQEIREKYGGDAVAASNAKMMGMSREQYQAMEALGVELLGKLEAAVKAGEAAFKQWREWPIRERAQVLYRVREAMGIPPLSAPAAPT